MAVILLVQLGLVFWQPDSLMDLHYAITDSESLFIYIYKPNPSGTKQVNRPTEQGSPQYKFSLRDSFNKARP